VNAEQGAALAIVVCLVVVALAAAAFLSSAPSNVATYAVPASAVHASLGTTASDGTIALRLNGISDTSNPATSSVWIEFNRESGVYNYSLTPPPASRYLVANVTVTNVGHAKIPFSYGYFVLVARDGTAYYANYAVCNTGCGAQALKNGTLNESFASTMYVLFSVPTVAQPAQLVYTAANPPLALSST
jgi:hypothetical protein